MTKLVITGNPGVGKHTSAKFLIERIGSGTIMDINKVALSQSSTFNRNTKHGIEVDTKKIAKLFATQLKHSKNHIIIIGHLAPYVLEPRSIDLVIVLRRSPYELMRIFEQRRYSLNKIRENIASEILGISFYDSLQTFGKKKIAELDTTLKDPRHIANEIVTLMHQKRERKIGIVDWLSLVHKKGDMQRFLEY